MEIYLTFDDGIQPGTEEVLNVLKDTGVNATFFLVGIQIRYAYKKNPALCIKLLEDIFNNHSIGNHSYSHAHYLFTDYYNDNGVQTDNNGNRMSITDDFALCAHEIGNLLQAIRPGRKINDFLLSKNQTRPLARLPARNTWYLTRSVHASTNTKPLIFSHREKNSVSIAKDLNEKGYEVFGWNLEWKMNYNYQQEAVDIINTRKLNGEYTFSDEGCVHPDFDMYAPGEEGKDRLCESWQSCFEKISSLQNAKTILLMHDRAFRNGKYLVTDNGHSQKVVIATEELRSLITALQKENVGFKKLDDY